MHIGKSGPSGRESDSSSQASGEVLAVPAKHPGSVAVHGEVAVAGQEWASVRGSRGIVRFRTTADEKSKPRAGISRQFDAKDRITGIAVSIHANPNLSTHITTVQAGEILGIQAASETDVVDALGAIYGDPSVDADTTRRVEPAYQFALQASAVQAEHNMFNADRADGIIELVFAKEGMDSSGFHQDIQQ